MTVATLRAESTRRDLDPLSVARDRCRKLLPATSRPMTWDTQDLPIATLPSYRTQMRCYPILRR